MVQLPGMHNLTFDYRLPIQAVSGTVRTYIHLRMAHWKLSVFTDVWVQTDYVHIVDLFSLLGSLPRLGRFGSTPYKASRTLVGEF
jgi:hypothetical protein